MLNAEVHINDGDLKEGVQNAMSSLSPAQH
jgi:hypothetical protein